MEPKKLLLNYLVKHRKMARGRSSVFTGNETIRDYTAKDTLKKSKGTVKKSTVQKAVNAGHNVQAWHPTKRGKKGSKKAPARAPSPELN